MSDTDLASLYRAIAGAWDHQQRPRVSGLLGSLFDEGGETAPGLLVPGNINTHRRPVVRNADGSISTVRSMTFTDDDGRAVLIPSVVAGRGVVPFDQAVQHYYRTGEHLGIFDTPEQADAYAQALHETQADEYRRR